MALPVLRPTNDVDVLVIGAGAVGLATAAVLARRGLAIAIVERHPGIAQETSSRNSGVIHAGLYYPTGTLKATLCVAGRELVYARCAREDLPHRACGKLVVATDEAERARLEALHAQAQRNGAGDVRLIDRAELARLEPNVRAVAALHSPRTGIVDAHALVASYRREAEHHGAVLALGHAVIALARDQAGWRVRTATRGGAITELGATWIVNSAGLDASRIAALAGLEVDALGYRQHPCKGDYFRLAVGHGAFHHLIYPVPADAGLGVHITFDLDGKVTAGPDTEYVATPRYDVDPAKAARFGEALRRYLPHVADADLVPDYAGIRPKLQGPGEAFRDFVIEEATAHGAPRLVNLLGIESPGLTASEAIAERVSAIVAG